MAVTTLGNGSIIVTTIPITVVGKDSTKYNITETDPIFNVWDRNAGIIVTQSQITDGITTIGGTLTTIGSDETTLNISSAKVISVDTTFPVTLSVVINKPGILTINDGITLTINGPFNAGLYQVFTGLGNVVFNGAINVIYPQWFGAIGDKITDNAIPFQKTLNAARGRITVHIPSGFYNFESSISIISKSVDIGVMQSNIIEGDGIGSTVLINSCAAGNATIQNNGLVRGFSIRDMSFIGKDSNPNHGIHFEIVHTAEFKNLSFDTNGDGIFIEYQIIHVNFEGIYGWWDILSDILGYTVDIRTLALNNGYATIRLLDGDFGVEETWANAIYFNKILVLGGKYAIYSYPSLSGATFSIKDSVLSGQETCIYVRNINGLTIDNVYYDSAVSPLGYKPISIYDCNQVSLNSIHSDSLGAVSYGDIKIDGAVSQDISFNNCSIGGDLDITADAINTRLVFNNTLIYGSFKNNTQSLFTMTYPVIANNLTCLNGNLIVGAPDGTFNLQSNTIYKDIKIYDESRNSIMNPLLIQKTFTKEISGAVANEVALVVLNVNDIYSQGYIEVQVTGISNLGVIGRGWVKRHYSDAAGTVTFDTVGVDDLFQQTITFVNTSPNQITIYTTNSTDVIKRMSIYIKVLGGGSNAPLTSNGVISIDII